MVSELLIPSSKLILHPRHLTLSAITSSLPAATDPAEMTALHAQLRTTVALHQEALSNLSSKETELVDLHSRLETLSQSSRGALSSYAKKIDDLERELRLCNEGKKNATTKLELVELELRGERKRLEKEFAAAGGTSTGGADQSRRLQELEGLVTAYKERVGRMELDSREAENKIAQGLGYVKKSEADELKRQLVGLNRGTPACFTCVLDHPSEPLTSSNHQLVLSFTQKSPTSPPSARPTPLSRPRSLPLPRPSSSSSAASQQANTTPQPLNVSPSPSTLPPKTSPSGPKRSRTSNARTKRCWTNWPAGHSERASLE